MQFFVVHTYFRVILILAFRPASGYAGEDRNALSYFNTILIRALSTWAAYAFMSVLA